MANKTIYGFARHCMNDLEFNCGGIPTNEVSWLLSLGIGGVNPDGTIISTDDLNQFYDALTTLRNLHLKYDD